MPKVSTMIICMCFASVWICFSANLAIQVTRILSSVNIPNRGREWERENYWQSLAELLLKGIWFVFHFSPSIRHLQVLDHQHGNVAFLDHSRTCDLFHYRKYLMSLELMYAFNAHSKAERAKMHLHLYFERLWEQRNPPLDERRMYQFGLCLFYPIEPAEFALLRQHHTCFVRENVLILLHAHHNGPFSWLGSRKCARL